MGIIYYIISLLFIVSTGYFFLKLFMRNISTFYKPEFLVYSFMLGAIIIPFGLFLLGWIGIDLSMFNMIIYTLILNFLLYGINKYRKTDIVFKKLNFTENLKKIKIRQKLLFSLGILRILSKLFLGGIDIFSVPTYQDDTFGNWNMRANVWYHSESLVLDKTNDDFLGRGYIQYPMTVSMLKTYISKFYGNFNDGIVNSLSFIFYICAIILIFFVIFRFTKDIRRAFLSSYLLTSIPIYHIHGTNPYFDLFQGLYFFVAIYFLYLYLEKNINLPILIIFAGILGYTKSEGLIIYVTVFFVTRLIMIGINDIKKQGYNFKSFLTTLGSVILINIPFIIFKTQYGLGFGNGGHKIAEATSKFSIHTEIFKPLYMALFQEGNYSLFFFAFLLILFLVILNNKKFKSSNDLILFIGFLIAFGMILFVYLFTFNYTEVTSQTGVNRSMVQLILILLVSIIFYANKLFKY